jgi:hypothetical protein
VHVQVQEQAQGLLVGTRPGSRSCSWLWGGRFAVPWAALSCGSCNELQRSALVPVLAKWYRRDCSRDIQGKRETSSKLKLEQAIMRNQAESSIRPISFHEPGTCLDDTWFECTSVVSETEEIYQLL